MSPKHHAPYIQIIHSFCLCLLSFFFVFFLFYVCCKSFSIKKISSPSMILSSCCNRQPSERLSPKRGPGGTGFQYGAKRHALAGTHSRHSALGQFNQETGRETAFVFFSSFKTFPFAALLGCCSPCSRCASSCEEPDGQTWRNIWGQRGGGKEVNNNAKMDYW